MVKVLLVRHHLAILNLSDFIVDHKCLAVAAIVVGVAFYVFFTRMTRDTFLT